MSALIVSWSKRSVKRMLCGVQAYYTLPGICIGGITPVSPFIRFGYEEYVMKVLQLAGLKKCIILQYREADCEKNFQLVVVFFL